MNSDQLAKPLQPASQYFQVVFVATNPEGAQAQLSAEFHPKEVTSQPAQWKDWHLPEHWNRGSMWAARHTAEEILRSLSKNGEAMFSAVARARRLTDWDEFTGNLQVRTISVNGPCTSVPVDIEHALDTAMGENSCA